MDWKSSPEQSTASKQNGDEKKKMRPTRAPSKIPQLIDYQFLTSLHSFAIFALRVLSECLFAFVLSPAICFAGEGNMGLPFCILEAYCCNFPSCFFFYAKMTRLPPLANALVCWRSPSGYLIMELKWWTNGLGEERSLKRDQNERVVRAGETKKTAETSDFNF